MFSLNVADEIKKKRFEKCVYITALQINFKPIFIDN